MDIEFAMLADSAATPPDGKLYILGGGFDEIRGTAFPIAHPALALVIKLRLHPTECGREHLLEVVLWDPEGGQLGPPLAGRFAAQRRADHPTRPSFVQLVFNLIGLQFGMAGEHHFHVVVDGQHLKTLPLYITYLETLELPGRSEK